MNNSISKVTVVGLGQMGMPIAESIANADFQVTGFDLTPPSLKSDSKISLAKTIVEAVADTDAVVLLLPNGAIVRDVLVGNGSLLNSLQKSTLIIDMSSSAPAGTQQLGEEVKQHGHVLIDAPVSGGVKRAATGSLAVMAGGSELEIEKIMPILNAVGEKVFHVGQLGSGHAVKALNNLLSAIGLAATGEILAAGKKAGINPNTLIEVLNASSGKNNSTESKIRPFVLSGSYDSGFSMSLMVKDMKTAAQLAQELEAPIPIGLAALDSFEMATKETEDGSDHTAVVKVIATKAGTSLETP